jgi:ribosomal protein L12E/L44/L45/RPP1/RPP2
MAARAAALAIAAHALDADDARMLLTALGVLVDGELVMPTPPMLEVVNIKDVAATGAGGAGFR